MERIKYLSERIASLTVDKVKSILWLLSYNPKQVLEAYGDDIDPIQFQEAIVEARMEKDKEFVFGSKEPKMNLYGVEKLARYNPVVRDTIIEHCLKISDDKTILRACILNICTKLGNFDYKERRREAFEILGFSEQVQEFLEKEIDTYCIGQVLKAIQAEKYPRRTFNSEQDAKENNIKEFGSGQESRGNYNRTTGECSKRNSQLDIAVLMDNKETVQQYIVWYTTLLNKGLDPVQIGKKREVVEQIYENAASVCN